MSAQASTSMDLRQVELDAERVLRGVRSLPQNPFNASSNQHSHDSPPTSPTLLQAVAAGTVAADSLDLRLDTNAHHELRLQQLLDNHDRCTRRPMVSAQTSQIVRYQQEKQMEIEAMVSQARKAMAHGIASVSGIREGAALMSRAGMTFSGCNIEGGGGVAFTSAAKMALLKALAEGQTTFERIVIVSDGPKESVPHLDSITIEALAQHGDFEVVLVRNDEEQSMLNTCTYDLLPPTIRTQRLQESSWKFPNYWERSTDAAEELRSPRRSRLSAKRRTSYRSKPILEWTTKDVVTWLDEECDLPSYVQSFRESRINGKLLLGLNRLDMEELLGIYHPLHLRRLTDAIDRLRQEEMMHNRPRSPQRPIPQSLSDEKVTLIVQLKEEFDKVSPATDGKVTIDELVRILGSLCKEVEIGRIHGWIAANAAGAEELTFHQVVALCMDLCVGARKSGKNKLVIDKNGHIICKENEAYQSWLSQEQLKYGAQVLDRGQPHAGEEESANQQRSLLSRHNQLDEKEFARLQRLFNREDQDCCGYLVRSEAARAISKTGIKVSAEEFGQYLRIQGLDSSAKVDLFEFARAYMHFAAKKGVVVATDFIPGEESKLLQAISVSPRTAVANTRNDFSPSSRTLLESMDKASYSKHMRKARRRFKYDEDGSASSATSSGESTSSDVTTTSCSSSSPSPEESLSPTPTKRSPRRRIKSSRRASRSKTRRGSKPKSSSLIKRNPRRETRSLKRNKRPTSRSRSRRKRDHEKRRHRGDRKVSAAFHALQKSQISAMEAKDLLVSFGLDVKRQHVSDFLRQYKGRKASLRLKDVQELYEFVSSKKDGDNDTDSGASDSSEESEESSSAEDFEPGEAVEARNTLQDSSFEAATVVRRNSNGTYAVRFNSGEKQRETRLKQIRRAKPNVSDTVRLHHRKGKVLRHHSNGTVDIRFEDSTTRKRVPLEKIKLFSDDQHRSSPRKSRSASRSRRKHRQRVDSSGTEEEGEMGKNKQQLRFYKGELVEARFKGKAKFYKGRVSRVGRNGAYDIEYEDGDRESNVPADLIRKVAESGGSSDGSEGFNRGDKVEARYRGKSKYYKGKITRVHADGTLDISYEDGDVEHRVDPSLARHPKRNRTLERSSSESDAVTAAREKKPRTNSKRRHRERSSSNSSDTELRRGDQVEARYKGKSKYYRGVITRANGDNTYDIRYNDGDRESSVKRSLIKKSQSHSESSGAEEEDVEPKESFREGEKVEARFKGKSKFYSGVITKRRGDGSYDIRYDDGDKESRVDASLIRHTAGGGRGGKFKQGDVVEARFRGKSKYVQGKVMRVDARGNVDIRYVTGEVERKVPAFRVRQAGSPSEEEEEGEGEGSGLARGDKVEARYRGKSKYYPGVITKVNRDGTFDIRYNDGDKESGVRRNLIKLAKEDKTGWSRSRSTRRSSQSGDEESETDQDSLRQGQKVEARYKGKSKYYSGVITRVNRDGTFDIRYDDGDRESGVKRSFIKAPKGSREGSPRSTVRSRSKSRTRKTSSEDEEEEEGGLRQGQKVEARYKGKAKYYSGVITRVNRDGTFDIRYDDGDKESSVKRSLIKAPQSNARSSSGRRSQSRSRRALSDEEEEEESDAQVDSLRQGQKVEARYKGKSKYYSGVITRVNRDNTFDIRYDDGDRESGVKRSFIKVPGPSSPRGHARSRSRSKSRRMMSDEEESSDAPSDTSSLRQGQKVEARYKGKAKYYSGVITRVNRDGTFDIRYDDGDRESGVKRSFIKVTPKSTSPRAAVRSRSRSRSKSKKTLSDDEVEGSEQEEESLRQGQKVEARYRGKAKFYSGVITRVNRDGTFDIRYDDGDRESGVKRSFIKAPAASSPREGRRSRSRLSVKSRGMSSDEENSAEDSRGSSLRQGQKVEARYKGKAKYYSGVITRVNRDGTFDIRYDDGDRESGVRKHLIKVPNAPSPRGNAGSRSRSKCKSGKRLSEEEEEEEDVEALRQGQKVEARYKGKAKYYSGVITRVNRDGTFDIRYDDGDRESAVKRSSIRIPPGDGRSSPRSRAGARSRSRSKSRRALSDEEEEDQLQRQDEPLRRGQTVEARYKGKSKFYRGKILKARGNDRYDIEYDDGDVEQNVRRSLIRSLESDTQSSGGSGNESTNFAEGDAVEARYKGKAKYYPGVISKVNRDNTFDIRYNDGDKETRVDASLIRRKPGASKASSVSRDRDRGRGRQRSSDSEGEEAISVGASVEARYKGKAKYYSGVVTKANRDGTFDIRYDDGDRESRVKRSFIRKKGQEGSSVSGAEDNGMGRTRPSFSRGDVVEARFKGRARYLKGKVMRINRDSTMDIRYDDGQVEYGVRSDLVRALGIDSPRRRGSTSRSPRRTTFEEAEEPFELGDKIEARFQGKAKYYSGRIIRCNVDGSFDIEYDDGDKERRVPSSLIRKPSSAQNNGSRSRSRSRLRKENQSRSRSRSRSGSEESDQAQRQVFRKGEAVEARFRGKSKYYKGKIVAVKGDGRYAIRYQDGDLETEVEAHLIRKLDKAGPDFGSSGNNTFEVGDQVQARYRGKAKYYGAVITNVNRDGSFNLRYDDGDTELKVKPHLVRKAASPSTPVGSNHSDISDAEEFEEGEEVEARFKGKAKFYGGRILRVRGNGSYDIRYNDGDVERNVKAQLIRRKGRKTPAEATGRYKVGDNVEARYRGKAKYYAGEITRVNRDGTFNIRYNDGDVETSVDATLIRSLQDSRRNRRSVDREVPDESDGELERSSSGAGFKRGEAVEARFRGKAKFYAGRVLRVKPNGMCDIRYDDGDTEYDVRPSLIRKKGGRASPRRATEEAEDEAVFEVGEDVEARFQGKAKFYAGKITRKNRDGSYDVRYNDGDSESRVASHFIRRAQGRSGSSKSRGSPRRATMDSSDSEAEERFAQGERIEARFKGKAKYFKGKISGVNSDGTYNIRYDDGDMEYDVRRDFIRKSAGSNSPRRLGNSRQTSEEQEVGVGEEVEARYRGKSKWYPGVVTNRNYDGTFDITYDDGDVERRVKPSFVRPKGRAKQESSSSRFRETSTSPRRRVSPRRESSRSKANNGQFARGDVVEARFKGKAKYYRGRIFRVKDNGTYDIRYDDGDTEHSVDPSLIREARS